MRVCPINPVNYKLNSVKHGRISKEAVYSNPSFNGFWKIAGGTAGAILGMATVAAMGAPALLAAPFLYAGMKWGEDKDNNDKNNKQEVGKEKY